MAAERVREAQFASAWAAGAWRGQVLRAVGGMAYLVLYEGRKGGGAGPDFRDAVLLGNDGARVYGDIELHLRPEGWFAHGHASDPRYDALALHVVLSTRRGQSADSFGPDASPQTTPLASGRQAPLVVLGALAPPVPAPTLPWPCAACDLPLLLSRLADAGWARFERRVAAARAALLAAHADQRAVIWRPEDRAFWPLLAEALAYGRDRASLRMIGERLAADEAMETLYAAGEGLPRVERSRVQGLLALAQRWQGTGPVATLAARALASLPAEAGADHHERERAAMLAQVARQMTRALVVPGGAISPGRAAIVVANVALPFLAAWGALSGQPALAERARALYAVLPGLPANTLTRTMTRQLGLARQPAGALTQQGLQEVWSATCREKHCAACVLGDARLTPAPCGRERPAVAVTALLAPIADNRCPPAD